MTELSPIAIARPSLGEEEWQAVREPLESGWLTQGPKVLEFENLFAEYHEVAHAVATTSCTTALHLALLALGIGPGDEVILPAFTWVATANVIEYCGATPVFVDVQKNTYNLDIAKVSDALTPRTKAVIAVHLFGLCVDMYALRDVLPAHIRIVEDAACAAGSRYRDQSAGHLGDIACFSFHPRKLITTGEGGMLTCDDAALASRCKALRNHGATASEQTIESGPAPHHLPDFNVLGFNYRMTDIQAAIGLVQLGKLSDFIQERQVRAQWYIEQLAPLSWLGMPSVSEHCMHAWQSFVTVVDSQQAPARRNAIMERLQALGVGTRPGTHAVTQLGYYRERYGLAPGQFPTATYLQEQSMALPLHNEMSDEDYCRVVAGLRSIAELASEREQR